MTSLLRVVTETEEPPALPAEPALTLKYEPDRFQKFAIAAIEAGHNVLITAKTGSGKTFVGEYQIAKSLARGGRVFYTTPIKSLSNQKFHDLKKLFPGASVGILTGDIKFNPEAQIIVMTTEVLRNLFFKEKTATAGVGVSAIINTNGLDAVIFDEVHYINDPDRGHVWEETIMLAPPHLKLVLLSATLASPEPFARWICELKGTPLWLISTRWRAVPLYHHVLTQNENGAELTVIQDPKEIYDDAAYKAWLLGRNSALRAVDTYKQKVKDARAAGVEGSIGGKQRIKSFEHQMNGLLTHLQTRNGLPAIFFVFSRAGCERAAAHVEGDFLDSSDSAAVAHIWDFHLSRYSDSLIHLQQYHKLRTLAMRGIAYHHSGLVPFLKEVLEILFSKGLVRVLFATETFAVGINMPTKTVVFTGLEKYDDVRGGFRVLRSDEYIQMAGRAGRRGKDDKGIVIYLPQREPIDSYEMKQMMTGGAARVGSRMTFDYDFILKVLLNPSLTWRSLLQNSYWYSLHVESMKAQNRVVEGLEAQIVGKGLSDEHRSACEERKELEERVATSQNAKKKVAQRQLDQWRLDHGEKWWDAVWKTYTDVVGLEKTLVEEKCILKEMELWGSDVERRIRVLEEYGFVKRGEENTLSMTDDGRLASEVNEGHPLLMTEMFRSGYMKGLNLKQSLVALAVFLGEPRSDDSNHIAANTLRVDGCVIDVFKKVEADVKKGVVIEQKVGVMSREKFWAVGYEWVEPVQEWLEGRTLGEICSMFELFEGNVQRAIMKLAGLAEEWVALATLAADTAELRKWDGATAMILRDIVVAESIYLRI